LTGGHLRRSTAEEKRRGAYLEMLVASKELGEDMTNGAAARPVVAEALSGWALSGWALSMRQ